MLMQYLGANAQKIPMVGIFNKNDKMEVPDFIAFGLLTDKNWKWIKPIQEPISIETSGKKIQTIRPEKPIKKKGGKL